MDETKRRWIQIRAAVVIVVSVLVCSAVTVVMVRLAWLFIYRGPGPSRAVVAEREAMVLEGAVQQYRLMHRGHPPPSLEALVTAGLIRQVPDDPWGHAYQLRIDQANQVEVRSAGPDGRFFTTDDVTSHPGDTP